MHETSAKPPEFWDAVADHVTAKAAPVLRQGRRARSPIIAPTCAIRTP